MVVSNSSTKEDGSMKPKHI